MWPGGMYTEEDNAHNDADEDPAADWINRVGRWPNQQ